MLGGRDTQTVSQYLHAIDVKIAHEVKVNYRLGKAIDGKVKVHNRAEEASRDL